MQMYPSSRNPEHLHIFVSHLWERDDAYKEFTSLLKAMFGSGLTDHSIPKTAALKLMSCGRQALEEERSLQHAHVDAAKSQLDATRRQRDLHVFQAQKLESEINISATLAEIKNEIGEVEAQLANPGALFLGERGLRLKQAYLADLRERAARFPPVQPVSEIEETLDRVKILIKRSAQNIESLEHELRDRYERIESLEAIQDPESHNVFVHAGVLMRAIRDPKSIARRHANLALAIYHKIRVSDIVFFLTTAHDMYREWMDYEYSLTTDMHKPVIVVNPDPKNASPLELYRYSRIKSIDIDRNQLIACLRMIFNDTTNSLVWQERFDPVHDPWK